MSRADRKFIDQRKQWQVKPWPWRQVLEWLGYAAVFLIAAAGVVELAMWALGI